MCCRQPFKRQPRFVPPFSIQIWQRNTVVIPPSSEDIYRVRNVKKTLFRMYYDRGDLPIEIPHGKKNTPGTILLWHIFPAELNYSHYLPIFFDGLAETTFPYNYLARSAIHDMLQVGGDKILPVIPQLIMPIKNALNTRNIGIIMVTLDVLQQMLRVGGPTIGVALVPYYRHFLLMFNIMRSINTKEVVAQIESSRKNIIDHIDETLQMMEKYGGPDAYINIKYMIPVYQSCIQN